MLSGEYLRKTPNDSSSESDLNTVKSDSSLDTARSDPIIGSDLATIPCGSPASWIRSLNKGCHFVADDYCTVSKDILTIDGEKIVKGTIATVIYAFSNKCIILGFGDSPLDNRSFAFVSDEKISTWIKTRKPKKHELFPMANASLGTVGDRAKLDTETVCAAKDKKDGYWHPIRVLTIDSSSSVCNVKIFRDDCIEHIEVEASNIRHLDMFDTTIEYPIWPHSFADFIGIPS